MKATILKVGYIEDDQQPWGFTMISESTRPGPPLLGGYTVVELRKAIIDTLDSLLIGGS